MWFRPAGFTYGKKKFAPLKYGMLKLLAKCPGFNPKEPRLCNKIKFLMNVNYFKMKNWALFGILITFSFLAACAIPNIPVKIKGEPTPEYHTHADFLMVINDEEFDFNKSTYMSTEYHHLSEDTHMHDFNPRVLHFHSQSATLGDFFRSIGMSIDSRCISTGNESFCSNGTDNLLVYVNERPLLLNYSSYAPADLDRILIYYGPKIPGQKILNSVTSESCIYSKRCIPPIGFNMPQESCTSDKPCTLGGA